MLLRSARAPPLLVVALAAIICSVLVSADQDDRVVLSTRHSAPVGWVKLTRSDADRNVTVMIALRQRNLDQLNDIFREVSNPLSPQYQSFLSSSAILDMIAPPSSDVQPVYAWLQDAGAHTLTSFGDALEARLSVAAAERLFRTELFDFQHESGQRAINHWGPLSIPAQFSSVIEMVSGLSTLRVSARKRKRAPIMDANAQGVIPQTIQSMYGVPNAPTVKSSQSSQGVVEFEESYFSPDNLKQFASLLDLTIPAVSASHIVGTNDPSYPDSEADLDMQYLASVGGNVPTWFWEQAMDTWMYGFAVHFFNTQNVPLVLSVSYGWTENDQCDADGGEEECKSLGVDNSTYVERTNTEFQKIGLRGITVVVSSGDAGANGRNNAQCKLRRLLPDFPAASPYVTTVGGTQVNNPKFNLPNPPSFVCGSQYSCISNGDEVAVSYDHAHFASGGGFSDVAPLQDWQQDAVTKYLNSGVKLPPQSYFNASGRAYPDIAALGADIVIFLGYFSTETGTSCSAPIISGVLSLLNDHALSKTGKPLGFINPLLYQMSANDSSCFRDITTGDNKCTDSGCPASCEGYEATTGWDPVTGLGTPQFTAMIAYLDKLFAWREATFGVVA